MRSHRLPLLLSALRCRRNALKLSTHPLLCSVMSPNAAVSISGTLHALYESLSPYVQEVKKRLVVGLRIPSISLVKLLLPSGSLKPPFSSSSWRRLRGSVLERRWRPRSMYRSLAVSSCLGKVIGGCCERGGGRMVCV
jgi:hypothetical protein